MGDPPYGGADGLILGFQAEIRRKRSPFEPPRGKFTPDLVPNALLRAARMDQFVARAQAMATQHDASDLAFNTNLRGTLEAVRPVSPEHVAPPPRPITHGDLILGREQELIESLQARYPLAAFAINRGVQAYTAAQQQQREEDKGFLDRLGGIVSSARDAAQSSLSILSGADPIQAGRETDSAVNQIRRGTIDLGAYSLRSIVSSLVEAGEIGGETLELARELLATDPGEVAQRGFEQTPFGSMSKLAGSAIQAWRERDPMRVFQQESGDAAVWYSSAWDALGYSFDGERFWHDVFVYGGSGMATGFGVYGDYGDALRRGEQNWAQMWESLPREAQLIIEETSPGNVALIAAGGPLARVLAASGTRSGLVLSRLIEPMAANPLIGVPTEVGLTVGGRSAWERTDSAPLALRIPAVVAGAATGAAVPSLVRRAANQVDTMLVRQAMSAAEGPFETSALGILRRNADGVIDEGVNERFGQSIQSTMARMRDMPEETPAPIDAGLLPHEVTRHNDGSVTVRLLDPDDPSEHTYRTPDQAARYLAAAAEWEPQTIDVPRETIDPFGISPVEPGDENLMSFVGFSDARGMPLPLKAALGDGGQMKVPHPDEILDPLMTEIRSYWSESDEVLSARIGPIPITRQRVTPGSRSTSIPDVLPFRYGPQAQLRAAPKPATGAQPVAGFATSISSRARDYARRAGVGNVPVGIADNIGRAEADFNMRASGPFHWFFRWFNQAPENPAVRQSLLAGIRASDQIGARVQPSRRQLFGDIRNLLGDATKLPDDMEYRGPDLRTLAGADVPATQHPMTGTIYDFVENPDLYDDPRGLYTQVREAFLRYDVRNEEFHNVLGSEYNVNVRLFDTGIAPDPNSRGIFLPIRDISRERIEGSAFQMRTHLTLTERLADEKAEPLLDIEQLLAQLDREKVSAVRRETMRWSLGGSSTPRAGWKSVPYLARSERIVDPNDPNSLIVRDIPYWLPEEEADAVNAFLNSKRWRGFEITENLKNLTLNMDASPITIMGALGWSTNPFDQSLNIIRSLSTATGQLDALRPFKTDTIYRDMAAAPDEFINFFTDIGRPPAGGTPEEWRNQWIEMVPGLGNVVGGWNDFMGNVILKGAFSDYTEYSRMLVQRGFDEHTARAAAGDVVKMSWLMQNFAELGSPAARSGTERGVTISPGFIRQPANLMAHAAVGYLQMIRGVGHMAIGNSYWQSIGPREQLAAFAFAKMAGTWTGLAALTAAYTAHERGWTPEEAIHEALFNFDSPDWMTVQIPQEIDGFKTGAFNRLPVGGPFRGLLRAIMPQPLEIAGRKVTDYPVPFGGLPTFFERRVTPAARTAWELAVTNRDFYGEPIVGPDPETGDEHWWGVGAVQALEYAALQTLPLAVTSPFRSHREGRSLSEGLQDFAWEFVGQNPAEASEFQVMEQERRLAARELSAVPVEQWSQFGVSPEVAERAAGFTTLADLRDRIGSRLANSIVENVGPGVGEAREAYEARMRRRASLGDETARIIIQRLHLDDRLTALGEEVTDPVTGAVDYEAYRAQRRAFVSEYIGALNASRQGEYNGRSDNRIDQLVAEVYSLREQATPKVPLPDGREVDGATDYELLEELENEWYAQHPQDIATLVRANVETLSLSAPEVEREYISDTRSLAESGFYDISREVWDEFKSLSPEDIATHFGLSSWVPPALREPGASQPLSMETLEQLGFHDAIRASNTVNEFRANMLPALTRALHEADGGRRPADLYLVRAKEVMDSWYSKHATGWLNEARVRWATEHVEDGRAHLALERGELTENQYTQALGKLVEQGVDITQLPTEWWIQPGVEEDGTSAPQSATIDPVETTFNDRLLMEFQAGASYEQVGIRHGLTGEAVRMRLRRMTGGQAPTSLRT